MIVVLPLPRTTERKCNRGVRRQRSKRKLHLGVDAGAHEIVAVELTPDDVGDVSELPGLLKQVDSDVASLTADGAYDGGRHPDAKIIIPPRATAVPNETTTTQRDQHIATIEKHGRMNWQRRSGYNRRSLVETAIYRYKTIINRRLQARTHMGYVLSSAIYCIIATPSLRIRGSSPFQHAATMTASTHIRPGANAARTMIPHSRGHRAQEGWDPSLCDGMFQPRPGTIATRLDPADPSDDRSADRLIRLFGSLRHHALRHIPPERHQ